MGGATRPCRDERRAVTGEAGDAMDARGFEGFGEGHRRQDGGEPAPGTVYQHVLYTAPGSAVAFNVRGKLMTIAVAPQIARRAAAGLLHYFINLDG
jgi:hypothetical protein